MTHDRDSGRDDRADRGHDFAPALELDGVHPAVLQEPARVPDRVLDRRLVGHEGHVADEVRGPRAAGHGAGVMEHVLHRHGKRRVVPEHDHAERVPDEDGVHARAIESASRREVVRGEHRDRLAAVLLRLKREESDFSLWERRDSGHGYLLHGSKTPEMERA